MDFDDNGVIDPIRDVQLMEFAANGLPAAVLEQFRGNGAGRSGNNIENRIDDLSTSAIASRGGSAEGETVAGGVDRTETLMSGADGLVNDPITPLRTRIRLGGDTATSPRAEAESAMPQQVVSLEQNIDGSNFELLIRYETFDANGNSAAIASDGLGVRLFVDTDILQIDLAESQTLVTDSITFDQFDPPGGAAPGITPVDGDREVPFESANGELNFFWRNNDGQFPGSVDNPTSLVRIVGTISDQTEVALELTNMGDEEFSTTVQNGRVTLTPGVVTVPTVSITPPPGGLTEGDGAVDFVISRTGPTDDPLSVSVGLDIASVATVADISSSPALDTVVIPAGSASVNVSVAAVDDNAEESDESLTLRINASDDYQIDPASATADATISDPLPVNASPTIATLDPVTLTSGQTPPVLTLSVGDDTTAIDNLIITAVSSNPAFLPDPVVAGGTLRTLTLAPITGELGSATVTVTVTDAEGLSATQTFDVTVAAPPLSDPPTIGAIDDVRVTLGDTITPVNLVLSDDRTGTGGLIVTAVSSDPALLPDPAVSDGDPRTLTLSPRSGATGTATVTVSVADDDNPPIVRSFNVIIDPPVVVNNPPTLLSIADVVVNSRQTPPAITLGVSDDATATADLVITATSSDVEVIAAPIVSNGTLRQLLFTSAGTPGSSTVTVTVSDGELSVSQTFRVNVTEPVNTPPTISFISPVVITRGEVPPQVSFIVVDDAPNDGLNVSVETDDPSIATATVDSDGLSGTVTLLPVAGAAGSTDVTVSVADADGATASRTFRLVIQTPVVRGNIFTPSVVDRPHVIPGNGRATAILFRSPTDSTMSMTSVGGVSLSPASQPQILDGDLNNIDYFQGGVMRADLQAGGTYALVFPPTIEDRLYVVAGTGATGSTGVMTNPLNRVDVNGDAVVDATDALGVINAIRRNGNLGEAETVQATLSPIFSDVDSDGRLTPRDALHVINYIRRDSRLGESESPRMTNSTRLLASDIVAMPDSDAVDRQTDVVFDPRTIAWTVAPEWAGPNRESISFESVEEADPVVESIVQQAESPEIHDKIYAGDWDSLSNWDWLGD